MTWLLRLSSTEFGVEEICYDTFKEACAGAASIANTAAELDDSIERTIEIEKAAEESDGED